MKLFVTYAFFLFFISPANAQWINFSFAHLTQQDGLLDDRYNYYIYKDSRGFIWISSTTGINRFDGINIKTYPNKSQETKMIGRNIQSDFFEDQRGDLWTTTYQALIHYDRSKDQFKSYQFLDQQGEIINTDYHAFYLNKEQEKLWLIADTTVIVFDVKDSIENRRYDTSFKFKHFSVSSYSNGIPKQIIASTISEMGFQLWTFNEQYERKTKAFLKRDFEHLKMNTPRIRNSLIHNDSIIWLFSDQGLLKLNPITDKLNLANENLRFSVNKGVLLNNQYLLIISLNKGLWLFDILSGSYVKYWENEFADVNSMASNNPRGIYIDNQNYLWLSHLNKGIDYSRILFNSFQNPIKGKGNSSFIVKSIEEDSRNNIWVATQNQGLFVFNHQEKLLENHPYNQQKTGALNFQKLTYFGIDTKQRIWCIGENKIYLYDKNHGKWEKVIEDTPHRLVFLSELSSGRILISSDQGILELIEDGNGFNLISCKEFDEYQDFYFIQLFETEKYIGVPYNDNELRLYEKKARDFQLLSKIHVGGQIYDHLERKDGQLWLATSKGILSIDQDNLTTQFLFQESLKSLVIYSLVEDDNGIVWISTSKGLWSFDKAIGLNQYREEDGLSSEQFEAYAYTKTHGGKIWLGNSNGLSVFDPQNIKPYEYSPQTYIDEIRVNNNTHTDSIQVGERSSIQLQYYENTLDFRLLALTAYLPQKSTVNYRLVGYDDNWATVENGQFARFTQVPHGKYILEMLAVGVNGHKSPTKRLNIFIKPPFWKTEWFRFLSILSLITLTLLGINGYTQMRLYQQKKEHDLIKSEHQRISDDCHDGVNKGLNNIQFIIEGISLQKRDKEVEEEMQKINYWIRESQDNLTEIISILDPDNNNFAYFLSELRSYTSKYLSVYDIDYQFDAPDPIPDIEVSGWKRRNLLLILKEALHNIIRHAKATLIEINIKIKGNQIVLAIKDNGVGIDLDKIERKRKGLTTMPKRAKKIDGIFEMDSKPLAGTLIKVIVPISSSSTSKLPHWIKTLFNKKELSKSEKINA